MARVPCRTSATRYADQLCPPEPFSAFPKSEPGELIDVMEFSLLTLRDRRVYNLPTLPARAGIQRGQKRAKPGRLPLADPGHISAPKNGSSPRMRSRPPSCRCISTRSVATCGATLPSSTKLAPKVALSARITYLLGHWGTAMPRFGYPIKALSRLLMNARRPDVEAHQIRRAGVVPAAPALIVLLETGKHIEPRTVGLGPR
jgi:hypothetical protein